MQNKVLQSLAVRHEIVKGLAIGIDVGIASCGWAVVDTVNEHILSMGSRCFEPSEEPKTKKLYNAHRREKRGMRRVTARRAGRMKKVRRVISDSGLLPDPCHKYFQELGDDAPDPWQARAEGLERVLSRDEAAAALIHIAKHRGFKSNSKRENKDTEGRKVLSAASAIEKRMEDGDRTYGQVLYREESDRKRNKGGDYSFMPLRDKLYEESKRLILTQRGLGADWATEELEENYLSAAFFQRPLQSSEGLVGECPFEDGEKRAAKFSYSFERFRLLEALMHRARIKTDEGDRALAAHEIEKALPNFGSQRGLSYAGLRRLIGLPDEYEFVAAPDRKDEKRDVTGSSSGAMLGSYTLRKKVLGDDLWEQLSDEPHKLDRIAAIITFNESPDEIAKKLADVVDDAQIEQKLTTAVKAGELANFKGAGNISAKAARKLIPEMLRGRNYYEACEAVGYDHAKMLEISIDDIKNPVVQRAVTQSIKQVEVMVRKFGRPERINIELLREVGKSADERGKITSGIKRRTTERAGNETEFLELIGQDRCSRDDLYKYELLKQQGCRCPFCDKHITPIEIVSQSRTVEIEHIYPRSRSYEDSFVNKVLSCIKCNQEKRNRTPWEWKGQGDTEWWREFEARVNAMYPTSGKQGEGGKREKKKRLLSKSFADREKDFIARNQVDASYVARTLQHELMALYPESYESGRIVKGSSRRILARPGRITAYLRYVWLSSSKYKKNRDDDRHHAMDALIVALVDESLVQKMTDAYQEAELMGMQHRVNVTVPPPWDSFAQDAVDAYNAGWMVCRTENRRARGQLHQETLRRRSTDEDGNHAFYERKSVNDLKKRDIEKIPDQAIRDEIALWIEDDKPADDPPRSAKGDLIRKVRLKTNIKTARQINADTMGGKEERSQGGFVENADMVRVDLFYVSINKQDRNFRKVTKGYYLVPVYAWDLADRNSETPLKAIASGKDEAEWPIMDPADFVMSLYKDSYVEVLKPNGEIVDGYYRNADRRNGNIAISPHNLRKPEYFTKRRPGVKGVKSIRKFHVDRFGEKHEIKPGAERWPGCSQTTSK